MAQAYIDGGPDKGNPMMEKFDPFAEKLAQKVDGHLKRVQERFRTFLILTVIISISVMLSLIFSIVLAMKRFSKMKVSGSSLLKEVNDELANMYAILDGGLQNIQTVNEVVIQATKEIDQGTSSQSAAIEETSAASEEFSALLNQGVISAQDSLTNVEQCLVHTENGQNVIKTIVEQMRELEVKSDSLYQLIDIITTISEKIKVINDIVMKTELLSFNASIEAARAAEHGRGFAIVADEVGSLARTSGEAAKEINEIIERSNHQVHELVESIKSNISNCSGFTQQGRQAFNEITTGMGSVNKDVNSLVTSFQEQQEGISQIVEAILELNKNMLTIKKSSTGTVIEVGTLSTKIDSFQELLTQIENLKLNDTDITELQEKKLYRPLLIENFVS